MKLSILGAGGRMGRAVISAALATDGFDITGALARQGSALVGRDVGELAGTGQSGVTVSDDLATAIDGADVAIDFTLHEATVFNVQGCEAAGCAIVIGTTGHSADQRRRLHQRDWRVPAVLAANMSPGVNVLYRLAALAARGLAGYDAEIAEAHHRGKQDAPSGTALQLGRRVAEARGRAFEDVVRLGRAGPDAARREGEIGIAALRAGNIIGEHRLLLAGDGERIEIVHAAEDRGVFARGALRAAAWVAAQSPGLYGMGDVLGLEAVD